MQKMKVVTPLKSLAKARTGIQGLDDITEGGLPAGRPTLVCGGPGCGKTLLAMEFLVRGAIEFGEPGVFATFEETTDELAVNAVSLGFDLPALVANKKLLLEYIHVDRGEFEETGEYDLEGLFIRLGYAIDSIKAKRVVLDTIEGLFAGLPNQSVVRSELRRLFRWLKAKGVTVIMTGERGDGTLTRYGLEEYVSDCVISLDHRVVNQVTTRRIRVVKYRGTPHGTDEYPFLIESDGISIWPITSVSLDYPASLQRVSTGIERLDTMLGGLGVYRGGSILISGSAGTSKTNFAGTFVNSACQRGERCLYVSFEESSSQIMRNMQTIGLELQRWVDEGLLNFKTVRPFHYGLEMHLAGIIKFVSEFEPTVVVIDPITALDASGTFNEVKSVFLRLLDFLKQRGITTMLTDLTNGTRGQGHANVELSSFVDTCLVLRNLEANGESNRSLHVIKSRGMANSNQIREFTISEGGIQLTDVYIGPSGMLTGSARIAQQARERADRVSLEEEGERQKLALDCKRAALEGQIAALRATFSAEEATVLRIFTKDKQREASVARDEAEMGRSRKRDAVEGNGSRIRSSLRRSKQS